MSSKQWKNPPAMAIDVKKKYTVSMNTSKGIIEIELYPEHAPILSFLQRKDFTTV